MKIIAIHETDKDLILLKQLVKEGHTIYTQKDGMAIKLLTENTAEKARKGGFMEIVNCFRFSDDTTGLETESSEEKASSDVTTASRCNETEICCERYIELDNRITTIEEVLRKPIL